MKGHLVERSPGHWSIVLDARDAAGNRKRRWFSFRGGKREAQRRCAELIAAGQSGGAVDPQRLTVAEYLDRYLADYVEVNVAPSTAQTYRDMLAHVRRHLGSRPLQKLRPDELQAMYAAIARSGLAPRTVRHVYMVFSQALKQAKTWRLVRDNVAEAVKPPPVPGKELPILQPEQARKLLDQMRDRPLYLFASIALKTGLRRGEILGLRWCDLNLDAGRLHVEQALEETLTRGVRVKAPKTRAGRRIITLSPDLVAELRAHWRGQQEQRLQQGLGRASPDSPVLATPDGGWLRPVLVSMQWPRAMRAIGMPGVTIHSLRHTHASTVIASGMDILSVSRRLGHGSPTITLCTYGHMIHGTDEKAATIIGQAFGSNWVANSGKTPHVPG